MKARFTEDLVADLARDLARVRPVARLRVAGARALTLWGAAVLLGWLIDGHLPAPEAWSPKHFAGLFGLGVASLGALVAALASAIPGREQTARAGIHVWIVGLVAVIGVGAWGVWSVWSVGGQSYSDSLGCVARSIAMGIAPLWIVGMYAVRGAVGPPRLGSALVLMGPVGLGALAVHATCPILTAGHVLLGHYMGPLVVGSLLSFALVYVWAQRSALSTS